MFVYWGDRSQQFREVFEDYGVVCLPTSVLTVNENISTISTNVDNQLETVLTANFNSEVDFCEKSVLMVNHSTVSTKKSEPITETVLTVQTSTVSTKRRSRGEGTGRIQWRTLTKKNGKQYEQAWYDWQLHVEDKVISKSTYIPKHLLPLVQELNIKKAPVGKILSLLAECGF